MNISAPKLIKLALNGQHMPFCPHPYKMKSVECQCWNFAAQKWQEKIKAKQSIRIKKARPGKTHSDKMDCGSQHISLKSNDDTQVTCRRCIRLLTNPPKRRRSRKPALAN